MPGGESNINDLWAIAIESCGTFHFYFIEKAGNGKITKFLFFD